MKPAVQARSKATRDRLLAALESLLKKRPYGEITVAMIAEEAGVSPGSVYRRFDRKHGLIPALLELYTANLTEWAAAGGGQVDIGAEPDLRAALRAAAFAAITQIRAQAHIMRAVYVEARSRRLAFDDAIVEMERALLSGCAALITAFPQEVKRRDRERAAKMTAYFFNSFFVERALFSGHGAALVDDVSLDDMAKEAADFVYGYLTTPEAE